MKRIFFALIVFLCGAAAGFAQIGLGVAKSQIDENYEWESPGADGLAFRIVSIDGKSHAYYVKLPNLMYAKVATAPAKSLGEMYFLPKFKGSQLVLYKMEIIDGKEVFTPQNTVELGSGGRGLNVIIGVYEDGAKSKVIDISVEKVPFGACAIVNLGSGSFGVQKNSKNIKLNSFEMLVDYPKRKSRKGYNLGDVKIFDLSKHPPLMYSNLTLDIASNERGFVFAFRPRVTPYGPDMSQVIMTVEE
ncbi:MAG: hypothetical protein J6P03_01125 [Opitutales bacterium]|nr:hypothetical protein [Opitutales bacterium]